jgi:hypothetical protein
MKRLNINWSALGPVLAVLVSLASIGACIVSGAALLVASEANNKADAANELAREANDLSIASNDDIVELIGGPDSLSQGVLTCFDNHPDSGTRTYSVVTTVSLSVYLRNNGRQPITLVDVVASERSRLNSEWIVTSGGNSPDVPATVVLEPGLAIEQQFSGYARSDAAEANLKSAQQLLHQVLSRSAVLTFAFRFSNGKVLFHDVRLEGESAGTEPIGTPLPYPTRAQTAGTNYFFKECSQMIAALSK